MIKLGSKRKVLFYVLLIAIVGIADVIYHWEFFWRHWAQYYTRDQDVVVAFTTTPYRIDKIENCLKCLSQQTFKPRKIYLSIPYMFKRKNLPYTIPAWLSNYPNITILRTEDYGPATKLLGALRYGEIKQNTIIITVDDDLCYPRNTLLQLVVRAKRYPNSALGYSGVGVKYTYINKDNAPAIMLEGYAAVAYRPHFFDKGIYDIINEPTFCYNADDLYIGFHLAKNKVMRRTVHTRIMNSEKYTSQVYSDTDDALHLMSHGEGDRYRSCTQLLNNKYPGVSFAW